jgi:hypothetical protein
MVKVQEGSRRPFGHLYSATAKAGTGTPGAGSVEQRADGRERVSAATLLTPATWQMSEL